MTMLRGLVPPAMLIMLAAAACNQYQDQVSVRPYEQPQLAPADGSVARDDVEVSRPADAEMASLVEPGRRAYRRYCWPCHGPNMDGKGTVGPSFPREIVNLTGEDIVDADDEDIYDIISNGSGMHPPLASTMRPDERWAVIAYIRAVQSGEVKAGEPEGYAPGKNEKGSANK